MGIAETRGEVLLDLYDRALPVVYGYLVDRCGDRVAAEDLTSETFLAAIGALGRPDPPEVSVGWLVGVARHKLADHWRARSRQQRLIDQIGTEAGQAEDPWPATIDSLRASDVLAGLAEPYRAALTFRYVDGLRVAAVADLLGRSHHATEALLLRARAAFRTAYGKGGDDA